MKKIVLTTLAAIICLTALGQEKQKSFRKTGWKVSPFPAISMSSDNGFQYGVFGDVYNYGNGDTYPDPLQKISFEASHFTKGRSRFRLQLDTKYLIPNMRLTITGTYVNDPLYLFYGYNGNASPFDAAYDKNSYYNRLHRQYFQGQANFQGHIVENLNWAAGLTYWYYKTEDFGVKFVEGDRHPENTLFRAYQNAGLISQGEAAGGHLLEMRAGLVYNSRDIESAPNKGIHADIFVNGAPNFIKGEQHAYLRLCANFAQYIRIPVGFIPAGDPVFAYHLGYQHTFGDAPFFIIQNVPQLVPRNIQSEGLGYRTNIRGLHECRVLAKGFAWANLELRVKLVRFQLLRQDFYLALNPFFDCGFVTELYRADKQAAYAQRSVEQLRKDAQQFIVSPGVGAKLAWNENFILSAEFAFNQNRDSYGNKTMGPDVWFSLGTNYTF